MESLGTHIILDLYDVNYETLCNINKNDKPQYEWECFINKCFEDAKITCLKTSRHDFNSEGAFTILYLLAESHLSIHTWPEHKYVAIDIFTCGSCDTTLIANRLISYFSPKEKNLKIIKRGDLMRRNIKDIEEIVS